MNMRYQPEFDCALAAERILANKERERERKKQERIRDAAPKLLEACKYVVKYHREHDSGEGELFGLDFVTTCIDAIVAAEKGGL